MKKDKLKLIYRLKIRPSSGDISIKQVQNDKMLASTFERAIACDKYIVVELSDKSKYDSYLRKRHVTLDNRCMYIEAYSLPNEYQDFELDSYTWYETEMPKYEADIMEFISQPNHPIFQFKWNPSAFIQQLSRWNLNTTHLSRTQDDDLVAESNRQRHLLRMTVMLNTIGVLRRGFYYKNKVKVELKASQMKTIVYNHQSKLRSGMTVSLAKELNYPFKSTQVKVINQDCLVVYEKLVSQGNHPMLLNMANAFTPGGGYRKGDGAQEEDLFRRSDYYRSLDINLDGGQPTNHFYYTNNGEEEHLTNFAEMYPMDEFGAIYTSGLTVFRQSEKNGYAFMDKPMFDVCAIAIAAYRNPKLDSNDTTRLSCRYSLGTRKKIENIFAIAHHRNHDSLVLSAFGCGAFHNPPEHMAAIFKSVIEQYAGFFKCIYFAVLDDHNTGLQSNPHGNFKPFQTVLDNLVVTPINQQYRNDTMIGPWQILNSPNQNKITLNDARIYTSPLCYYGGRCRDLNNRQHDQEKFHPPMCPSSIKFADCKLKGDLDHSIWFRHQIKCSYGAQCRFIDDPIHQSNFQHPIITAEKDSYENTNRRQPKLNNDRPIDKENNMVIDYDAHLKQLSTTNSDSLMPICPFTPFHCRQYTKLSQSTNIKGLPLYCQSHCSEFLHVCRFGHQCENTSTFHLKTVLHIPRVICPDKEKCQKMNKDDHLNSFSHPNIDDIRNLCRDSAYQCIDLNKVEHIRRYRHAGNFDCSSAICYSGLNMNIDFMRNQYNLLASLDKYTRVSQSGISAQILAQLQNCIRGLLPVYSCSKMSFELMLKHGHVMSLKRIYELQQKNVLIQSIRENKKIQAILYRYKEQSMDSHVLSYINALADAECNKRAPKSESTMLGNEPSSQSSALLVSDSNFNNVIRNEEKNLLNVLTRPQVDMIYRNAMEVIEKLFDIDTYEKSIKTSSDRVYDMDNHICAVLGPQIRDSYEDIILVFKQEVMFHPDANFSIGSKRSFIDGSIFQRRPWIKDSSRRNEPILKFQESKFHCSIPNYAYVTAQELWAMTDIGKKINDFNAREILTYLMKTNTDSLFEAHLPEKIPLDYIEKVYIPSNIFSSLTPTAQQSAKTTFRDALKIIDIDTTGIPSYSRQSHISETKLINYRETVINEIMDLFLDNMEYSNQLYGTTITLAPSNFVQHVPLPFTITQIYDQYRLNTMRTIIPDEIYIYWQAMYGDIMITLSTQSMDIVNNGNSNPCLICYISETPSTAPNDYYESYSYINFGDPSQHATNMNRRSFLAYSNTFHRGCNVEDFLTYCLTLQKQTGRVILSHAGPNSVYNETTISYTFPKSTLDLNDLSYISVSAGARRVPLRNITVRSLPMDILHPSHIKQLQKGNTTAKLERTEASSHLQSVIIKQPTDGRSFQPGQAVRKSSTKTNNEKALEPCPDSFNCRFQTLESHCKTFSHPCPWSELCPNQGDEPYLTHEVHQVEICILDKDCTELENPSHRISYRHTGLPDFLTPCSHNLSCPIMSQEHRRRFSHGEDAEKIKEKISINKSGIVPASLQSPDTYLKQQQKPKIINNKDREQLAPHVHQITHQQSHSPSNSVQFSGSHDGSPISWSNTHYSQIANNASAPYINNSQYLPSGFPSNQRYRAIGNAASSIMQHGTYFQ